MTIFYSATSNGFYPDSSKEAYVQAGCWPDDGVEVSERWYSYLINNQGNGKEILPDDHGQPVLKTRPEPGRAELIRQAEETRTTLMSEANTAILPLQDAQTLGIATADELAALERWRLYRVMLNRLDISAATDIVWPEKPA
ncbi:tail fiber assembly protein [Scandinavium sp. H11S7]|uniref:Tail fiber assembly protein n=1 Tax=Scandinavium hiltneri TaxID=2926519 RepID=A0ABT2E5S8_9ENTR|nr:tail fiber assembly protein [Scandinavium hiltneri]MCS2163237.1 tail fiber assembly protein [Scandinavium hiltneri]